MNWFRPLSYRLKALFHRRDLEAEMAEEMRQHLERRIEEFVAEGMTAEEARQTAQRTFGGMAQVQEQCRDERRFVWLEQAWQDVRFAMRSLRRNPGFTLVILTVLTLVIGANTAIFSVVNAALFRPLPYRAPDRLFWLNSHDANAPRGMISLPDFSDWIAEQTVFEHIGFYTTIGNYALTGRGDAARLTSVQISAEGLAALGLPALIGRVFNGEEDRPGGAPVVVLSHKLWLAQFGGDATIVNQTILLNGSAYTVIGVMPLQAIFPSEVDLWLPAGPSSKQPIWTQRKNRLLRGVGRLREGVSIEQARAEMDAISSRLERQYPETNKDRRFVIDPLVDYFVGDSRRGLWTLLGAVTMVLLIACANVANLLLARAATRQREIALRVALGAGRGRIVRQLLTEGLLLSLAGSALGVVLANVCLPLVLAINGGGTPRGADVGLDFGVLLFSVGVALVTGVLFGLVPAWHASRTDVRTALHPSARGHTKGSALLRRILVVAEIACTLVLLIGAGLLFRSFVRLNQVDLGFAPEGVLSFRLNLSPQKYSTDPQRVAFFTRLNEKLRALPGAQAVGLGSQFPLGPSGWGAPFLIEGQPVPGPKEQPVMDVTLASPDYFRALGISLVCGRFFSERDNQDHLRGKDSSGVSPQDRWALGFDVVIIDEQFAQRHWPNQDPIGQRVIASGWGPAGRAPILTVIGVVARVKLRSPNEQEGNVQAYLPLLQSSGNGNYGVLVRATLDAATLTAAVRQQVQAVDPEQPIYDVRTLATRRSSAMAPERFNLILLGLFAVVALLLAVVGLYGVLSYGVTQRRFEIGVRLALGAQRGDIIRLVVLQAVKLVGIGVGLGLVGAFATTRAIAALLYHTSPVDPWTFTLIPLLLGGVALLACWLPARRATKVDPLLAMRAE